MTSSSPSPEAIRFIATIIAALYSGDLSRLRGAIDEFTPDALRAWSEALGQPTFVGSSGRVFPKAMKASPLLRAWIRHLDTFGVLQGHQRIRREDDERQNAAATFGRSGGSFDGFAHAAEFLRSSCRRQAPRDRCRC